MAEPTTLTPPVQTGSAVPPSGGAEIKVTVPTTTPLTPPKAGSPKANLFERLDKRGKPLSGRTAEPEKPAAAPAAIAPPERPGADEPAPNDDAPGDEDETSPIGTTEPKSSESPKLGEQAPATTAPKPKVNPWKLVDEHKTARAKLEHDLAETRKLIADPVARKTEIERLTKAEQRAKELEDHILFVDYSKSQEFQEKYQKPYEQSWAKAMADLKDITVSTEDGNERGFAADDMLNLVNMSLPKARELANQLFGDFADDVMQQRKEIRSLFDAQNKALDDARTTGAARVKEAADKMQAQHAETAELVTKAWTKYKDSIAKDEKFGKHFTPADGDEAGNQRLAKGFALVERAFSENPMDPKHTPEQRESIIKRQAAVYNRAAAFSKAVLRGDNLEAKVKALETELAKYKGSEPTTAGTLIPSSPTTNGGKPMDSMMNRLAAKAKRM